MPNALQRSKPSIGLALEDPRRIVPDPQLPRFTRDGSEGLEEQLTLLCQSLLEGVRQCVPQAQFEALVLGGGYGRGEGGVLKTPAGDRPYNDLECYVFLRGNHTLNEIRLGEKLHRFSQGLSEQAGLDVELKIDSLRALRRRPISMFSYDLLARNRRLYGSPGLFEGCEHHLRPEQLPLSEATRLLLNRFSGLLLVRLILSEAGDILTPAQTDFIGRNQAKAQLALGDAVIASFGQYHWSCLERHDRLKRLTPALSMPWLQRVLELHATGVEFKLHPYCCSKASAQLRAEQAQLAELGRELWLWLESRRLNCSFDIVSDYALNALRKCSGTAAWRNCLLNLRIFGLKGMTDRYAARYPRERLFNALPLLLWSDLSFSEPRTLRWLQRQLGTRATALPALVHAYQRIWPAYG